MNTLAWARAAKTVALIGFFLPWTMVSCSGQKLATMSGVSLAMGTFSFRNPITGVSETQHGSPDIWIFLAILAAAGGLMASFSENGKDAGRLIAIGAITALALSVVGMGSVYAGREREMAKAQSGSLGGAMNGIVQVHTQYGFWLTLMSLGAAAALGFSGAGRTLPGTLRFADPPGEPASPPPTPAPKPPATGSVDDDVATWDAIGAGAGPGPLYDYLERHPGGRFVELAHARLEQMGAPPEPEVVAAACGACAAPFDGEGKFCTTCGAPRAVLTK